jgi:hypothetical protein
MGITGFSFNLEPDYPYTNDRDYTKPEPQNSRTPISRGTRRE